jgi:hypothetical protein
MTREEFVFGLDELTQWFKVKLNEGQTMSMYKSLQYIPQRGWQQICKDMVESRKPSQGYFPTVYEIHAAYSTFAEAHPDQVPPPNYDRVEDQRFPVSLMEKGFQILARTKNVDDLLKYAASVRMPRNDIDRIIEKFKRSYGVKINFDSNGRLQYETIQGSDEVPF